MFIYSDTLQNQYLLEIYILSRRSHSIKSDLNIFMLSPNRLTCKRKSQLLITSDSY